jgi:hypothetical protein
MMPCISKFNIWRTIIQRISNCTNTGMLRNPLGKWNTNPLKQMKLESVLSSNKQHLLIQQTDKSWYKYTKSNSRRNYHYFSKIPTAKLNIDIEDKYIPVDVNTRDDQFIVNSRLSYEIPEKLLGTTVDIYTTQ